MGEQSLSDDIPMHFKARWKKVAVRQSHAEFLAHERTARRKKNNADVFLTNNNRIGVCDWMPLVYK